MDSRKYFVEYFFYLLKKDIKLHLIVLIIIFHQNNLATKNKFIKFINQM